MRNPMQKKIKVSNYITPEGYKSLVKEFNHLWKVKRPKATKAVQVAAAMGDRSENADYIYGKKLLREIDSRMSFLKGRVEVLTVVDRNPADTSRVFFGAWVTIEDEEGNAFEYRIVGPDETDAEKHFISIDSPMAKALLGKTDGDEVIVRKPNGTSEFVVVDVRYESS
jgi:transcription elongation factor GreB